MAKTFQSNGLELLPAEILDGIVKRLDNHAIKRLSCVSWRMRDVCLPFLFRKTSIEFSNAGFDLLENLLQSHLHRYIVTFQYVLPELLKPEIRNYAFFKREILSPDSYVETCEGYDDVSGREDWDELEYLSGDHPSYTRVFKTVRRTCAEQQEIIEAKRASTLISLAIQRLSNLKELELIFCETLEDEAWVRDYQSLYDMTMQEKSYESHIQLVLAALGSARDRSGFVHKIQLTHLSFPDDTLWRNPDWYLLTILLAELVKHAPRLGLLGSDSGLTILSHTSLSIRELELCSIYAERVFVENFLQSNAKSLHSVSAHNVKVFEREQKESIDLSPAHIRDTIHIPITRVKRLDKFSCPCSFGEGWKLFLDHGGSVSAARANREAMDMHHVEMLT